tara:strand:- start:930 stop:1133 length:204 start_codon:yes stop_codon:yes gene_type:complete
MIELKLSEEVVDLEIFIEGDMYYSIRDLIDLITDKLEEEDEEEFIEFKEMETKAEFKYKLWKYLFAN